MQTSELRFVADTHTLWWYLTSSQRLSPAASAIFRLAETGNATLIVPAIALAELHFVSVKIGEPKAPSILIDALLSVAGIEFSDLGRAQLDWLDRIPEVPEMHDRLIAAEAMVRQAPVVTRDAVLSDSPQIETIW